jgi:hypothetical protein
MDLIGLPKSDVSMKITCLLHAKAFLLIGIVDLALIDAIKLMNKFELPSQ